MFKVLAVLFILAGGCSSGSGGGYMMPDTDDLNTAPAAAWRADGFTFRKSMPDRREWKPWEFYYKSCATNGDEAYYSKTSYNCAGPFY